MPIPRGNRREPVVLRKAYGKVVDEEVEAARRDVVPVLPAVLPAGLGNDLLHAFAERVVVDAGSGIGEVHAPLPLEVHRLVRNRHRTLLRPRGVLVTATVHRHAFVGDLHPRRKRRGTNKP